MCDNNILYFNDGPPDYISYQHNESIFQQLWSKSTLSNVQISVLQDFLNLYDKRKTNLYFQLKILKKFIQQAHPDIQAYFSQAPDVCNQLPNGLIRCREQPKLDIKSRWWHRLFFWRKL